jgi:hypothetical protein
MLKLIKRPMLIFFTGSMALIVFLLIAFQDDSCDKIGNVELPECVIDN